LGCSGFYFAFWGNLKFFQPEKNSGLLKKAAVFLVAAEFSSDIEFS